MKVILEIDHTVSKEEIIDWLEGILMPSTPCVWGYSFEEHHCGSCQNSQLEKENEELKEELKICQSVASEIVNKMKNCGNCKYFTHKLLNRGNIRICKINPNNIYDVCDSWELPDD